MSDYLSDEEQVDRLRRWWSDNGVSLIVGVVLAIAVVLGWRFYQDNQLATNEGASDAFEAYLDARGNAPATGSGVDPVAESDPAVAEALAKIDSEYEGTSYHVFTLLHRADAEVARRNWAAAKAHLEEAVGHADEAALQDIALYRLAKIQYQLDEIDSARTTLGRVSTKGFDATVAELIGDIELAAGNQEAARKAFAAGLAAADPGEPRRRFLEMKLNSTGGTE